ncbi:MAG: ACP S-malonyltransferase [Clostridia bacterium]|nr:ACP S-malonyltransferase [Clostridia bacterium]
MKKAFLFAGQGAQKVGMAKETANLKKVKTLFEAADKKFPGLIRLMLEGEQELLNRTVNTQPAMFVADLAYAYKAEEENGAPQAVCGFSVGEIPALVYAGALSLSDGLDIIGLRASLMDEASVKCGGKMIAVIGLDAKTVEEIAAAQADCWAVNYNAPLQTVVAASNAGVDSLCAAVKEKGGRALPLKVSGAFHCPYMLPATKGLAELLKGVIFAEPKIPVYANLTALPYGKDEAERKDTLARQASSPVRFVETLKNMKADGICEFTEVGPGNVLAGLVAKNA